MRLVKDGMEVVLTDENTIDGYKTSGWVEQEEEEPAPPKARQSRKKATPKTE